LVYRKGNKMKLTDAKLVVKAALRVAMGNDSQEQFQDRMEEYFQLMSEETHGRSLGNLAEDTVQTVENVLNDYNELRKAVQKACGPLGEALSDLQDDLEYTNDIIVDDDAQIIINEKIDNASDASKQLAIIFNLAKKGQ